MFRTLKPTVPALQDRQTYIPPHIESAMAEHAQQSMPAHLKKYQGGNTYIPEHAQAEMTQHLESSLPPHMKQYAGAYMQQNVVEPSIARRSAIAPPPVPPESLVAPVVVGMDPQNPSVQPVSVAPAAAPGQAPLQSPAAAPNQSQSPDQAYNFITNPVQESKQPLLSKLPGGNSLVTRAALAAGALVVLLIIFAIFKSLLSSTPASDSFITVAQQQQELIHLVSNASTSLSANDQNLAATMQASLTSSQGQVIQYLASNNKKVNAKQLNLKVSAATDTQLANAATAGTYVQTFHEVMQTALTNYGNTLTSTYKLGQGPKGQALLKDDFRQLQLFQTQLTEPAN